MKTDYSKLSKILSYTLRHSPQYFGLKLDPEGWIDIDKLVNSLRQSDEELKDLTKDDIYEMVANTVKKRHEIRNGLIRAVYGHSTDVDIRYTSIKPPFILYHGTAREVIPAILNEGLKPIKRLYVHLSVDKNTAEEIGKRKDKKPVILKILAQNAFNDGIDFYFTNDRIWLTKVIPPNYIELINDHEA